MLISVFTPTNSTKYLDECYASLKAQTHTDWEWILVPNAGVKPKKYRDKRVKVFPYESRLVGDLKGYACEQCKGEWLVELDHDDELAPTALEEVAASEADFVYSNCVQATAEWAPFTFDESWGWKSRLVKWTGHDALEIVSPEPYPSNFSRVWFCPNHVRAWRRAWYKRIGGHDREMQIADDHDICCRTYLSGAKIEHIDKPLYLYRVHGGNAWIKLQAEIDAATWVCHDKYFIAMQEKWSKENGLRLVDIGGRLNPVDGYESYDRMRPADIVGDLDDDWKLEDQSCGIIRAYDCIEHLKDPVHTMNEAWRCLAHGGLFATWTPSTDGQGAFCDPTHKSYWNFLSWRYYTTWYAREFVEPECKCVFQPVKVADGKGWFDLPYVQSQLLALHRGPRYHGVCEWREGDWDETGPET